MMGLLIDSQFLIDISCDSMHISCQKCCHADWDCNSLLCKSLLRSVSQQARSWSLISVTSVNWQDLLYDSNRHLKKMKSSSLLPILRVGRLTFSALRFWLPASTICTGCLWLRSSCNINNCIARAASNSGVLNLAPSFPSVQLGLGHSREQVAMAKTAPRNCVRNPSSL